MKRKIDLTDQIDLLKNAKRIYRDTATDFVIKNPEVFPFLLEMVFDHDNKRAAIKSAWVLELVCQKNIFLIQNHLDYFIDHIYKIKDESALRPMAKVCAFIAESNTAKEFRLTEDQKEKMISANFDWLIGQHKIATQVYAMDTLYLLGKEFNWVHDELKLILEKNTSASSAGYQAHAKKILHRLK
ncbi:MAG: adenylosuccinate lyase, partial [Flavobacteriaceae bacterium]|nr:adenylosuccinate lyase [Flavobacteriaceae bacterium]